MLILLWMTGVAVVQFLSPLWLFATLVGCAFGAWWFAPLRSLRLLRRVRFLVLAILVLFAGFTPGDALWTAFQSVSPSREGVMLAAEHAGRLLAVVLCVALLLERLSVNRLVSGLYALLQPFERFGLPTERLAVRLMLVLRYVETVPRGGWQGWLDDDIDLDGDFAEPVVIGRECLAGREIALLVLLAAGGMMWLGVWR
ncbi:energy-coupling factor transporter transmembrane protein EcfT [Aromatoleum diolicum]|nr:energy-coupling factor transporter transmembrane protein EcfT [Aromatoleum diolicum]